MRSDEPRILISLTSVPPRFETSLPSALQVLSALQYDIVLSIPRSYRKWPNFSLPASLESRDDVTLHRPLSDWGPATKLLGAIDYLVNRSTVHYDYVVTFDDDIWYRKPADAITLLRMAAEAQPIPTVVTFGGFRLLHHPYARNKRGLQMNNAGFVDAVCGFQGVLYPGPLIVEHHREFFETQRLLSDDIFHDDDVYFGIVLGKLGVPIWAIPPSLPEIGFHKDQMIHADEHLLSAADFDTRGDRRERQPLLFQEAVRSGFLPNPFTPRTAAESDRGGYATGSVRRWTGRARASLESIRAQFERRWIAVWEQRRSVKET